MYLHIEFENGSNPYIFYGKHPGSTTHADCEKELARWSKGYEITEQTESHGGIYVRLREKSGTI